MSPVLGKCNRFRRIVRLRQMLQRWRNKARTTVSSRPPPDVPAGHVAVCVGSNRRRFIVRATHLNHPFFKKLLVEAEEEYGFSNQGPLVIPCEEAVFEGVLRVVTRTESGWLPSSLEDWQRHCFINVRSQALYLDQSRPLLGGILTSQSFERTSVIEDVIVSL